MRTVYDALADHPEAQKRYRESGTFREYIDALNECVELAKEGLSLDEYGEWLIYLRAYTEEWSP